MTIRVGNTGQFKASFYDDPYNYVPAIEVYETLRALGVQAGSAKFENALKQVTVTVISVNEKHDSCFVKANLFGQDYELLVWIADIKLSPQSIADNKSAAKKARLAKQEQAGQLRLFK